MVPQLVCPGRRNERGQSTEKLQRLVDHVGRPVALAALETVDEASVCKTRQPFSRHGRSPGVPAQSFEPSAIARRNAHVGVYVDAARLRATLLVALRHVLHVNAVSEAEVLPAGPGTRGDVAADRGAVEPGQEGLLVGEGVGLGRVGVRAEAMALEVALERDPSAAAPILVRLENAWVRK